MPKRVDRENIAEAENYLNSLWEEIYDKLETAKKLSKEITIKKLTKRLLEEG